MCYAQHQTKYPSVFAFRSITSYLLDDIKPLRTNAMVKAIQGTLIECDPSIRALIIKIDSERHDIVIQELDETHLLIADGKVDFVKSELNRLLAENTYNPLDDEEENQ